MKPAIHDVVIVGAGAAGCATALALYSVGITDIALVEAAASPRHDWVGELLPPDVSGPLRRLGVWNAFQADGHEPCLGSCSAWGGPDLGYNDFLANVNGPGWHIHRPRFDALFRRAVSQRELPIWFGHRVTSALALDPDGGFRLRLLGDHGEKELAARHIVDASGPRGVVARCVGSPSVRHDLLVFFTATAALPPGAWPSRLTMSETVADGWWYAAALPGHRLSLAFATDREISRARRLERPAAWLEMLAATRHIAPRLAGTPFGLGPLVVRAVPVSHRPRPCGAGWTAVGDAAAVFDPLGSEGIYKALDDALRASEAISASLRDGRDRSTDYAAHIATNTRDHLALRREFYRLERQWPDSSFWRNRLAGESDGLARAA